MKYKMTVLAAALTLSLAGSSLAVSAESEAKDSIVIYVGSDACSGDNDPCLKTGKNAISFFNTALMKFDEEVNLTPDLATEYEISGDNLTYTFYLREDVKFSDGTDFTAEDVVFTYETAKASGSSIDLTRLESAEALDDYTVEFKLSEAYSPFITNTAMLGIVPSDSYNEETYAMNPVGTGPYVLVEMSVDQQMVMVPNEYYYGNAPYFQQVTVLALSDDTVLAALQAGTLDLACIPSTLASESIEGMELISCDTIMRRGINLCTTPLSTREDGTEYGNDVMCDPAVREALNIGINRQEIIDNALNGYGEPAYYLVADVPWANNEPELVDGRPEDACRILEDAGWVDTDGDGIREKDGVKAEFKISGSADEVERYNIAVALAQQAEPLGIKIEVESLAWADCRAAALTEPTVWSVGYYEPIDIWNFAYSEIAGVSWYNSAYYQNETVDKYIEAAIAASYEDSMEIWKKAQYDGTEGINVDYPYLWIVKSEDLYFKAPQLDIGTQRVHGVSHNGLGIVWNIGEWSWNE